MAQKKKVTLHDVAQKSGFSITTVSHVINKTRHVDENTRSIIKKTIAELGYNVSQTLQKKTTNKTIGVVISDIRVDFFTEVIRDMQDVAYENDYNLLFSESSEDEKKERYCIEMFLQKGVDGIILAPTNCQARLDFFDKNSVPMVLIDRDLDIGEYDFVGIDNFQSAYEATKNLLNYGAKNLGYIGFDKLNYPTRERKRGFEVALHESGLHHEHCSLTLGYKAPTDISEDIYKEFLLNKPRKDGILCASSNICFELLSQAEELGIKVPEELLISAYDDNKWYDFLQAPVTAIKQPTGDIAVLSIELLINKIMNNRQNSQLRQKIILAHTISNRFTSKL